MSEHEERVKQVTGEDLEDALSSGIENLIDAPYEIAPTDKDDEGGVTIVNLKPQPKKPRKRKFNWGS